MYIRLSVKQKNIMKKEIRIEMSGEAKIYKAIQIALGYIKKEWLDDSERNSLINAFCESAVSKS